MNKIKTIYKIAISLNVLIVAISAVNLVINILNESRDVFIGCIYLLIVPYFKFLKSQSYFEIIPTVIFFALTIFLLYKSSQYYYKTDKCKPLFVFIYTLWIVISSLFSPIAFNSSNLYKTDELIPNIIIFCILGVFQSIVCIITMCDYYRGKSDTYSFSFTNTEDIFKSRYLLMTLAVLLSVISFTLKYVCCSELMLEIIKIWYIIFGALFIVFLIGLVFEYKKILKIFPKQKWNKSTYYKFVSIQSISILIYAISFFVLILI